jgi:outer membrane protein assembly factor BamD
VGDPSLQDPKRTLAPEMVKQNLAWFKEATGQPADNASGNKPTGANEPPRSDRPSEAPVQAGGEGGSTNLGVTIVGAPNSSETPAPTAPANDPNALVKPVVPQTSAMPQAEKPAVAPDQINDIKPGQGQQAPATANGKEKKPKADLSDESSSKKKKKKGLGKLNPF